MKNKLDYISTILITVAIILLIISVLADIIVDIKVINKVKEPENCVIVNGDYYCKKEL